MTNDTLFTLTPSGLTDADYLRRYRAAEAVAAALGEPIDHHLRDWSPAHINRFRELAKIEPRTTHTPGPWYTGAPEWPNKVFSRDRHAVAMAECSYMNGDEEDIANARLIAAAPDLLAIVAELARYDGMSGDLPMLIVQARAAIAKTTNTHKE